MNDGAPTVRLDVAAGLTAAAVVIPKAMAYATIAQLPVQVGLYTACIPMAAYALLGTSVLAAIVITYSIELIRPAAFRAILQVRRTEFVCGATAAGARRVSVACRIEPSSAARDRMLAARVSGRA